MAIVTTEDQNYRDIAQAIRFRRGGTERYRPREMAQAIRTITVRCPHADVLGSYTPDALPMTWSGSAAEQEQGG